MIFVVTFLLTLAGALCLAWAMPKHFRQWFSTKHMTVLAGRYRIAGWSLLVLSQAICLWTMSTGLAITYFLAVITLSILCVAFVSSYLGERKKNARA